VKARQELDCSGAGFSRAQAGRGRETMIERQALRRHIEDKFARAELEAFPFPHLIIQDFFPEDVYTSILENNLFRMNPGREWITRAGMRLQKNATPYDHRRQINFHTRDEYVCADRQRAFWEVVSTTFLDGDWFPRLVYAKYPCYFDLRFGEAVTREDFWPRLKRELFLQRHEPDYHIGPHTDISTRIFTCIFSFADRSGFERYGTQLLRHKDPYARCWGDAHYGFEDYEVVKTAEYRPNNFLLFFKTRQSFHAVDTISPDVPNQRYGMQFQLYEPSGGLFRDLSRPGLMRIDHQNQLGRLVSVARGMVGAPT
jgi:hypothetical protein